MNRFRGTAAAVLAAVFLLTSSVAADSGGGGSTTTDADSNDMTYITIGLALLVGGFLAYDAITDSGEETAEEAGGSSRGIIDTGVDWDHALSEGADGIVTVAVSVFPGPEGQQRSMQLIGALKEMSNDNVQVYGDPVELGGGPEVQRAALASEFFGADYLVFQVAEQDSLLQFGVASPDSILWTSSEQSNNSAVVTATELLRSGIF